SLIAGLATQFIFTQEYIFTDYSRTPFHEPAGVLTAGRLYPLLRFRIPPRGRDDDWPVYLRVDYRLHLTLDEMRHTEGRFPSGPTPSAWPDRGGPPRNQAGIFQDQEALSFLIPLVSKTGL